MNKRYREELKGPLSAPVGWLFADLLLALAMLFLIANTVATPLKPSPTPMPTPTQSIDKVITPSPTPLPRLETRSHVLILHVDYVGLLKNSLSAIADVERQVRSQSFLQGQRAGLVIPFGGAPSVNQESTALQVASKVVGVLEILGKQGFVFIETSYHDPLHYLGNDFSFVQLEIYLYVS